MRVVQSNGDFDPGDPYDAMCESFRIQVGTMLEAANRVTIFRDMPPERQLSAFMSGVLTGLVGAAFVCVRPEGRDIIMGGINEALPHARKQAEDIIANFSSDQ